MATLVQRKLQDGTLRYKAIVRRIGAPTTVKSFRTRAEARRWATKIEAEIIDGRNSVTPESRRRTVNDLLTTYAEDALKRLVTGSSRKRIGCWQRSETDPVQRSETDPPGPSFSVVERRSFLLS